MDIKPVKTKADYKAALKAVESLVNAKARTPDGDRQGVLLTLIEAYERQHFPMDLPDAVEAIKFRVEQQGLIAKDLEPLIGRGNRVCEVLNRKRGLTPAMRQRLHTGLGIPAGSLLKQCITAKVVG